MNKKQPHNINKMPIPNSRLKSKMMLIGEMVYYTTNEKETNKVPTKT
jgi:hypothetical protein